MQLQAHFHHIQPVIVGHLQAAESEILAAVAWFTDREIFEVLCKKAQKGLQISVAVLGDDINRAPGALNFQRLCNLGGKVTFLPPGSDGEPMMHHKFCVIDGATVITGSYNWSKKAQRNDENITVATEAAEFAGKYRQAFQDLIARAGQPEGTGRTKSGDAESVRRRLEMLRNLILLGDLDDVSPQVGKLKPVAEALRLQPILIAIERGEYKAALESIEDYLRRGVAVVVYEDADIARLKLHLQVLELRLESLTDEKSDLERTLVIFNRRYNEALGNFLIKVLAAQTELARHKAAASRMNAKENQADAQQAERDAKQAEQDWEDYRREYAELQLKPAPIALSEEDEAELKRLYRKACSLCHPDKFADEQKAEAHQAFVALQEVYNANDLSAMRALYGKLKNGGLPNASRSGTLSRADALRAAIAELQHRITEALHQFEALYNSESAVFMRHAGEAEADWPRFFAQQEVLLKAKVENLRQALADGAASSFTQK